MPFYRTLTAKQRWDNPKKYARKEARTLALRLVYGTPIRLQKMTSTTERGETIIPRVLDCPLQSGDDLILNRLFQEAKWSEYRQSQIAADFHRRYRVEVEGRRDVEGRAA